MNIRKDPGFSVPFFGASRDEEMAIFVRYRGARVENAGCCSLSLSQMKSKMKSGTGDGRSRMKKGLGWKKDKTDTYK